MMLADRYRLGEEVRAHVAFTNEAKQPMAATGVTFTARKPNGATVTAAAIAGAEPGTFYADFLADEAGTWAVRAECSGPSVAVDEGRFQVAASLVL